MKTDGKKQDLPKEGNPDALRVRKERESGIENDQDFTKGNDPAQNDATQQRLGNQSGRPPAKEKNDPQIPEEGQKRDDQ